MVRQVGCSLAVASGGWAGAAPPIEPAALGGLQQRVQSGDWRRDQRQQRDWQQLASGAVRGPNLSVDLGAGSRLVYQLQRPELGPSVDPAASPKASLGLQFQTSRRDRDPRSLLMVQVSAGSSLQFRPRSGGIVLTYRSQF